MKNEFENEVAEDITEATEEIRNEQEQFDPMLIGAPNKRGQLAAEDAYGQLTETLNELQPAFEKAIFQKENSSTFTGTGELFEFINSKFPEKWITRRYIEANEISIANLDSERIIELELVRVPAAPDLLALRQRVLKQLEVVKASGFYYPVSNLYNCETGKFEITNDLFKEAEKRFCRVTQSQAQNEIVTIFNELCEVLNKLHRINIIRGKNGSAELNLLDSFIDVMKEQPEDPFVVKDTLFYTTRLYGYRIKGMQSRNPVEPDKILS